MKETKKTIGDLEEEMQTLDRQLQAECPKCDGTGRPRTKTGEPARTGVNVKCSECMGTGLLGYKVDLIEEKIVKMKKDMKRFGDHLNAHINRQTAEIRVIEDDGSWGDYSGVFFVDSEDEKNIVMEKARKHFEMYFRDTVYHRNKKLGIFLHNPRSGKTLIEEIKTD
tara:strand:- start:214 stop:714 length:501 start_codon:yes stop_codon:yes gene_type:complete